jgi:NAD(P)-dependent dehydrogenase (short-subunit alcohol dehydrogenase family)
MSVQVLDDYVERLSRWGRWGPDDQLGALNLVTADHVALVHMSLAFGETFDLDSQRPAAAVMSAGGHIINVTSTAGSRPVGSSIPYAVSKAALIT